MKRVFLFIAVVFAGTGISLADEGMWLPNMIKKLNYTDMQKLGCKLSPEQIYDINKSSLKDAIFQLGKDFNGELSGFCTGEIVSDKGLMFTNHHCGYEAIATLSSVGNDYLTNGFWAKTNKDELPVPGLAVSRVVRIEDVTATVLKDLENEADAGKRESQIKKRIAEIEKQNAVNGYRSNVKEMFKGNEYYLFVYEVFNDVRLVGAPPSSIGKFGGDTDNWMWPRHTGDFSIFRVYMSPDGKPADYSANNVPYKPLHFLPISLKGINEGDFSMIFGYPGETERFITSYGMKYKMNVFDPTIVGLFEKKLEIWKKKMDVSNEVRIALADEYASIANTWKNFKGECQNLKQTDAIEQREAMEKKFMEWVNSSTDRKNKYGKLLTDFDAAYKDLAMAGKAMIYASLGLLQASQTTMDAFGYYSLYGMLKDAKKNKEAITGLTAELKAKLPEAFAKYYPEIDKQTFLAGLQMYYRDIAPADRVKYFDNFILKEYKGKTTDEAFQKYVDEVFEESIFTSKERMAKFLDKPTFKAIDKDLMFRFAKEIVSELQFSVQPKYLGLSNTLDEREKLLIEGLRLCFSDKSFYPDANSTLRLSYGTVKSYDPRDGAHYKWMTYIDGIMEKMDNNNPEFVVPQKLVDLYNKKDYGRYADKEGRMPVAFLSNNDITGGNSGSPVINGNGELIGLAFDGNWEWLTGNLIFNDKLQRTINVDVRYVLFVIDKFAGATNIIDELKIVN